ncbi:MAG: DUF1963 domain-containing protein [Myxococcales bacterium]|nr:DUF1963 domain-containing protein [Myxococcales bacterium]
MSAPLHPTIDELRRELVQLIEEAGLREHRAALESFFDPAIRFRTRAGGDGDLALGCSRLGGMPDLPPGFAWPEGDEGPLRPILQLDLRDVAGLDPKERLPSEGWLWVFADVYWDDARVFFASGDTTLVETARDDIEAITAAPLAFHPFLEPAPPSSAYVGLDAPARWPGSAQRLNSRLALPDELARAYRDQVVVAWHRRHTPAWTPGCSGNHQLFGHAETLSELRQPSEEVLFAIASDDVTGFQYGDAETAKILIAAEALAARDFAAARHVY